MGGLGLRYNAMGGGMRPTEPRSTDLEGMEHSVTAVLEGCWFLEIAPGEAITVSARGIVLGRDPSCDIVLSDRKASQRQAVVVPMGPNLELLALGRNPTWVDGESVEGRTWLTPGQSLELPGLTLRVGRIGAHTGTKRRWLVETPHGSYGLRQLPFSVGGNPLDSLQILDWPASALTFRLEEGILVFESAVPMKHGERQVPAGAVEVASPGDVFTLGAHPLTLLRERRQDEGGTELPEPSERPKWVRFEFLARGGVLTVDFGMNQPHRVQLPELRARLVAALLGPPRGYRPGEYLPDEVLIPAVWSGGPIRTRSDLNVLLHHTRKALMKAGLNPNQVLSRAKMGGATCFLLATNARVEVV